MGSFYHVGQGRADGADVDGEQSVAHDDHERAHQSAARGHGEDVAVPDGRGVKAPPQRVGVSPDVGIRAFRFAEQRQIRAREEHDDEHAHGGTKYLYQFAHDRFSGSFFNASNMFFSRVCRKNAARPSGAEGGDDFLRRFFQCRVGVVDSEVGGAFVFFVSLGVEFFDGGAVARKRASVGGLQ